MTGIEDQSVKTNYIQTLISDSLTRQQLVRLYSGRCHLLVVTMSLTDGNDVTDWW